MARPWYGNGPLGPGRPRPRRQALEHRRADRAADRRELDHAARAQGGRPPDVLEGLPQRGAARARRGLRDPRAPRRARLSPAHVSFAALQYAPGRIRRLARSRMRFPLEVAAEVREAWPATKPLFVRGSSIDDVEGGWCIEDTIVFAKELKGRSRRSRLLFGRNPRLGDRGDPNRWSSASRAFSCRSPNG